MAAMKPRTGDGPLEVTKEGRGIVMRVPLEGGGRLVVELNAEEAGALSAVFLEDRDQHPREARRFELTAEAVSEAGATAVRVESGGETRPARLLWTTMLGDLVSIQLAANRGVDPGPVVALERFKEAMRTDPDRGSA